MYMDTQKKQQNISSLSELEDVCERLIGTLQDEENIYMELVQEESAKKDAILDKNSKEILKLTQEQENKITLIDRKEEERSELIKQISAIMRPNGKIEKLSDLNDAKISASIKERLLHHSYALKELMITLKNITDTNMKILEDNRKLFETIIEELSEEETIGYGPGETKQRNKKSIFVNQTG